MKLQGVSCLKRRQNPDTPGAAEHCFVTANPTEGDDVSTMIKMSGC